MIIKISSLYFNFLRKINPIIYFVTAPVIFVLLFGLSLLTGITGAKYAEEINIFISPSDKIDLSTINFKGISFNDNPSDFSFFKGHWVRKKYTKGILAEIRDISRISEIKIKIGEKDFNFNREKFINEWHSQGEGKDGNVIYRSPDYIYYAKSRFEKFAGIINWPDEKKVVVKSLIKSLISLVLLPIALLFFFLIMGVIEYLFLKIRHSRPDLKGIILLIFVIILTFVFVNSTGIHDVKKSWLEGWWMNAFVKDGFIKGYTTAGDNYPPISFIILGLVKVISDSLKIDIYPVYKTVLLIFLLFTTFSFLYYTKDYVLSSLLHLFLSIASVSHGYMDVFFAPFIVLSLFALYKKKYLLFTIYFALASLMKYQPVIILPFLFIYLIDISDLNDLNKIDYKRLFSKIIIPAVSILLIILVVFRIHFIVSFFKGMQHSVLSANAFNFNWILTYLLHIFEPLKYGGLKDFQNTAIDYVDSRLTVIPRLCFVLLFLFTVVQFFKIRSKTFKDLLVYSNMGYITYFIFNTGVHQNHLYLVVILFAVLVYIDNSYRIDFIIWSLVFNVNIFYFYAHDGKDLGFSRVFYGIDVSVVLSLITIIFYFIFYFNNIIHDKNKLYHRLHGLSGDSH